MSLCGLDGNYNLLAGRPSEAKPFLTDALAHRRMSLRLAMTIDMIPPEAYKGSVYER